MLPSEQENIEAIRRQYAADLDRSERLLSLGLRVREALASDTNATDSVKAAIMGMLTRAVRLFRLIQLACERGMVDEADILVRSLFSGLLAERFILHRRLSLRACSPELHRVRTKLPPFKRRYGAAAFRVLLHVAYSQLRSAERFLDVASKPGGGRLFTETRLEELHDAVNEAEATVGAAGVRVWRRSPKTYSGLTEKQMAECYRLTQYYEQVYGTQSDAVHGSNTANYIAIADGGTWVALLSDPTRLPEALRMASSVFGLMLADANSYFRLGLDAELDEAADEFSP